MGARFAGGRQTDAPSPAKAANRSMPCCIDKENTLDIAVLRATIT
jgi:hypothetical protein